MMFIKKIKLKSGNEIPCLGFGTWQLTGSECLESVKVALKVGYRHIDTAERYGNQTEIGKAIKESEISRKDLFITSKVWRTDLKKEDVAESCRNTLQELQTDYIDLYLIHWPNSNIPMTETLSAMKQLKDKGKISSIGVSNFTISHLKKALSHKAEIDINQVEFHPSFNQKKLKNFCEENGIVVTAYSPLGQGKDLSLPTIKEIAEKYGASPSQVILNWLIKKGMTAIPRSSDPDHIKDNFKATEWKLEKTDIEKINKIEARQRLLNPSFAEFKD